MRYCRACILPDTRPGLVLDETDLCNACAAHGQKPAIDWGARAAAFRDVVANAKSRSTGYDCIIPVSGGKDSTWQVVTCLEHGLQPLCVTWKTPARTRIGQANLDSLVALGVDHIDYQINPRVEARFMLEALRRCGDPGIPMHLALFSIPEKLAAVYKIPLVIWGENPSFEYGDAGGAHTGFQMDADWLRRVSITQHTTAEDWISESLTRADLTAYFGPTPQEINEAGVLAVFLGYYFAWDPEISLAVAAKHGFQRRIEGPKTGYYDYADIDDDFVSIHHYLKWYKFGFTRLFDNLSLEIRNGRMSRDRAVSIVRETGDQTPHEDIERFCAFSGVTAKTFFELCEPFRNPKVWTRRNGMWMIDEFLVPDWTWS